MRPIITNLTLATATGWQGVVRALAISVAPAAQGNHASATAGGPG